jgi:hypothetical protein
MRQLVVESRYFGGCSNKSSKARAVLACTRVFRCFPTIVQKVALALLILALPNVTLLIIVLTPATLHAATIAAPTCSSADVSAAVQAAKNGDTVLIPPGTCTWTRGLGSDCPFPDGRDRSFCLSTTVGDTKWITIQGAGIGQTIIIDAVSRNAANNRPTVAISWRLKPGGLSRITGIEFRSVIGLDGNTTPGVCEKISNTSAPVSLYGDSGSPPTAGFRLDHNKFVEHGACQVFDLGGTTPSYLRGVIDHNFFDFTTDPGDPQAIISNVYNYQLSWQNVGTNGDNSWAKPNTLGTAEAIFFEDNVFHNAQTRMFSNGTRQFYALSLEGADGARIVARHNNFRATVYTHHGTGSAIRSVRQFEIYDNDFTGPDGCLNTVDATGCNPWNLYGSMSNPVVGSRGGVGVVFNNRVTWTNGGMKPYVLNVVDERTPGSPNSGSTFGACNGSNVWDQNTQNGRLCIDQPGAGAGDLVQSNAWSDYGMANLCSAPYPKNVTRGCIAAWPRQVADPNYEWNNTINGTLVTACHIDVSGSSNPIVDGVDCIHGPRPDYTPYTYPHPLTTGATTSGPAPAPPTGLRVQ